MGDRNSTCQERDYGVDVTHGLVVAERLQMRQLGFSRTKELRVLGQRRCSPALRFGSSMNRVAAAVAMDVT